MIGVLFKNSKCELDPFDLKCEFVLCIDIPTIAEMLYQNRIIYKVTLGMTKMSLLHVRNAKKKNKLNISYVCLVQMSSACESNVAKFKESSLFI